MIHSVGGFLEVQEEDNTEPVILNIVIYNIKKFYETGPSRIALPEPFLNRDYPKCHGDQNIHKSGDVQPFQRLY